MGFSKISSRSEQNKLPSLIKVHPVYVNGFECPVGINLFTMFCCSFIDYHYNSQTKNKTFTFSKQK